MFKPYILLVCLAYLLLLALLAWAAERRTPKPNRLVSGIVYALTLGVTFSSWNYGAGISDLAAGRWYQFYSVIGPLLAITVAYPIWRRIAVVSKRENIGSISDFLTSRYGKNRSLGALAAWVALVGVLPFIAQQLAVITRTLGLAFGDASSPAAGMPVVVLTLAAFAIFLGARSPSLTRHNRGLLQMTAVESAVKLGALLVIAGLAVRLLMVNEPESIKHVFSVIGAPPLTLPFVMAIINGMALAITWPRQFHLGFVELEDVEDLKTGRWLFPLYVIAWAASLILIAVAAKLFVPGWSDPNTVLFGLPITYGNEPLVVIAFLGSFSTSAALVLVEAVALSGMISNAVIIPWLGGSKWANVSSFANSARMIVYVRRAAIVAILLAAVGYLGLWRRLGLPSNNNFLSLVLTAQLAPAVVGGVLWRRGHAKGAAWGIVAGIVTWLLIVVAPRISTRGYLPDFEWASGMPLVKAAFESGPMAPLFVNFVVYVIVSLRTEPRLVDRVQAAAFVDETSRSAAAPDLGMFTTVGELRSLVERFLGREDTDRAFAEFNAASSESLGGNDPVNAPLARAVERMLAGAIGVSSARNVIGLALAGGSRSAPEVRRMLDETAQAVQFSRELLQSSIDTLEEGVCVVDGQFQLLAWNASYCQMFGFSAEDVYVGARLDHLVRREAMKEGLSPAGIDQRVEERLGPVARRERQLNERVLPSGLVLRVTGAPTHTGEYVFGFSDVTELRESARVLEQRVAERTAELSEAKSVAEHATNAKTRFVAAVSHDLLQPLNAARLYLGGIGEKAGSDRAIRDAVNKADLSIQSADRLLRALLNLSRIEIDGIEPEFTSVELNLLLKGIYDDFAGLAKHRGVDLRILPTTAWARSDPDLLRSVLQNLVSNAVRYTPHGGRVVVGCRKSGGRVRISVLDNGPGIASEELPSIFQEFVRLPTGVAAGEGMGLGLAIVQRICGALGHRLEAQSQLGSGSVFSVSADLAQAQPTLPAPRDTNSSVGDLKVLCIDDDPVILDGMGELMRHWGVQVSLASTAAQARACAADWDVVLADYELGEHETGLEVLETFRRDGRVLALVTATASAEVKRAAAEAGVMFVRKPIAPRALRAILTHAMSLNRASVAQA